MEEEAAAWDRVADGGAAVREPAVPVECLLRVREVSAYVPNAAKKNRTNRVCHAFSADALIAGSI